MAAKLIDQLGNFEDALDAAVKLAGASGEPVPQFPRRPGRGLVGELVRGVIDELTPRGAIQLRDPRL